MNEAPRTAPPRSWLEAAAAALAALGLGLLALQLVASLLGPIRSDDLWWHIALGDAYRAQGPWLEADPLLYTASAAPPPHSWLFDVAVSAADSLGGSAGLRGAHVAIALGIVWLAYAVFRRESGERAMALLASAVLLMLMADRLGRLRPDLFSMPAAIGLFALLLSRPDPPGWGRAAIGAFGIAVWANFHAAFGIGPLLLAAGLLGVALRYALKRFFLRSQDAEAGEALASERVWATRIGVAIGLGLLLALLNPRGLDQHLAYLISSGEQSIGSIGDDWVPFDPFASGRTMKTLGPRVLATADGMLLAFAACALLAGWRLVTKRDAAALRAADPVLLGLSAAACIAIFISQRFLWMSIFPLLFVLRSAAALRPRALASVAAGLLALGLGISATRGMVLPTRAELGTRLAQPFADKYPVDAVHFLSATRQRGHLMARYSTSGFHGYWLAPELLTTVNGSLNFPASVFNDYFAVSNGGGVRPGETFRDALDRQSVDLFLGVGVPEEGSGRPGWVYTTLRLENEPGWLLVSRGPRHAIHLRDSPPNAENLARIARFYEDEGIPFDRQHGLDVKTILEEHSDWAIRMRMIPPHYPALRRLARGRDPARAFDALRHLATLHLVLGDYESQLLFDWEALSVAPRRVGPRRRSVFGLLRLGRAGEAVDMAREMVALAPSDRLGEAFLRAATLQHQLPTGDGGAAPSERADSAERFLLRLPVLPAGIVYGTIETELAPRPTLSRSAGS